MSINYEDCFTFEHIDKQRGRKAILYLDQNISKFYRFDEESVTNLKDMMYAYSYWGIIEEINTDEGIERNEVVSVICDEFSAICRIGEMIDEIMESGEEHVERYTHDCHFEINTISSTYYWVMFWDRCHGYKFTLSKDELLELKKVVSSFTEYMIQNSICDR